MRASRSAESLSVRLADNYQGIGRMGDVVQLALYPVDVSIAEEMDTLLLGYSQYGYRADEACPIHLVEKDTGKFRVFDENDAFQVVNVAAGIQSDINEVDPNTRLDDYQVKDRALGAFVPTRTEANASYDVRAAAARRIRRALDLDREIRIFGSGGLLSTATNFAANNRAAISAGAEWNDAENSDPILDIQERIEASAQPITGIYLNPQATHAFLRADRVRSHMRQMLGDSAPVDATIKAAAAQQLMDFVIPGLPPFHVVPAKMKNETSGLLDFILTDNVILVGNPGGTTVTSGEEIMTAMTFRVKGPSGTGYTTREFELPKRGLEGGMMMISGHGEDTKVIASNVGGIITNVIQ